MSFDLGITCGRLKYHVEQDNSMDYTRDGHTDTCRESNSSLHQLQRDRRTKKGRLPNFLSISFSFYKS